jgi:tetratricopeptide (TPR) repeat protein
VVNIISDYVERSFDHPTPERAMSYGKAATPGHAMRLNWEYFPDQGCIDFISAGKQNEDYSTMLNGLNWDQFYLDLEGGIFLDAWRDQMTAVYDYVLIDSRTGLSDSSKICTLHLPDDLVVCFTLSDQSIDGAVGVARHIENRYADKNIRILPVPMRVDEGEMDRANRSRAVARARFRGLPSELHTVTAGQYWGSVEIPYKAIYSYEEVLATFQEAPGLPNTVLGAFERLVGELTKGSVTKFPGMPVQRREAILGQFARRAVPREMDSQFQVWFAIEDQMWADWVVHVLSTAGFEVTACRVDLDHGQTPLQSTGTNGANGEGAAGPETVPLALLTAHFQRGVWAQDVWSAVSGGDLAASRPRTIGLRLGSVQVSVPSGLLPPLDLTSPSLDAGRTAESIVRHIGGDDEAVMAMSAALEADRAPRYPGLRPAIMKLPSRNNDFTGREEEIGSLRDCLTGRVVTDPTSGTQALHGLGGVGKSQLAREYAYRYQADYDIIWWVQAERVGNINTEMAELAAQLDLKGTLSDTEATQAVRAALADGTPTSRWLMIFDNAEDPETLKGFLPGGEGHVIITSRNAVWRSEAVELEVDVFTPEESTTHLRRRVPGLREEEALQLALELGHLPLAVEHAAAYLEASQMSVKTYMELLARHPDDMFSEAPPADYPLPIKTTFAVSLQRLEKESPAAKRLLQMSVFLGPDPFSQRLVYKSPEMLSALAAHDPQIQSNSAQRLGRIIFAIRRLSLAKVDGRNDTIWVHRVLQALLRAEMSPDEQAMIRRDVEQVLIGQRPLGGDVEEPEIREAFDRIRPHLTACSVESSENPRARQLMVDLVRLLWRNGDFARAKKEGDRIANLWNGLSEADEWQVLELRTIQANILRDLGEYQASLELDQKTWQSQRDKLGPDDPSTLATARGLAAGLRAMGRYQEALERDLETHQLLLAQFVEEDRTVLSITHSLAVDYRLIGDSGNARVFDEKTERTRRQVLGPIHDRTLLSQLYLARDKRDVGEVQDAAADLQRLLDTYKETRRDDDPDTLRCARSLAVSLRVLGRFDRAAALTRDTYARYIDRYGEDHFDTLTCALSLAADEWSTGQHAEALKRAEGILVHFRRRLGDRHPNSLACADNVAVYLRAPKPPVSDFKNLADKRARDVAVKGRDAAIKGWEAAVKRSVTMGEEATGQLSILLGADHPFTLCAAVNLANAFAEANDPAKAEMLERDSLQRLVLKMGESHPDSIACRSNLAVTLRELGQLEEARRLHDRAVQAFVDNRNFGESHPDTVKAERWERISHVLELQSW